MVQRTTWLPYIFEQYDSPCCWSNVEIAEKCFKQLKIKKAKLAAVKDQMVIRYLFLGQTDAHRNPSDDRNPFTSRISMDDLLQVIIVLAELMNWK